MRPVRYTRTLLAGVVGAIAAAQTTAGAGNLVINGTLASGGVATLSAQQFLGITSTGNLSGVNFTVVGTDDQSRVISQTIAGPNNNTVQTTLSYRTVTRISVSAAVGTNVTVDTVGAGASQEVPIDQYQNPTNVSLFGTVTGTVNWTAQYTGDNIFDGTGGPYNWVNHSTLVNQTGSAQGTIIGDLTAVRFVTNSGTGSLACVVIQGGVMG
jgi:hypothetical protein